MAFTTITLTGSWERADGQPASGRLTATLSTALRNGAVVLGRTPITGILNAAGQLADHTGQQPFTLLAVNDPATVPTGAVYKFVLELDGSPPVPFTAVVPYNAPGATVDLSTLEPT